MLAPLCLFWCGVTLRRSELAPAQEPGVRVSRNRPLSVAGAVPLSGSLMPSRAQAVGVAWGAWRRAAEAPAPCAAGT
jgi:hypothetical protein